MSKRHRKPRVFNETSRCWLKPSQVEGGLRAGILVWVEEGRKVRALTLAELVALRAEQARMSEPPPMAEIYGVKFQEPSSEAARAAEHRELRAAADHYAHVVTSKEFAELSARFLPAA